MWFDLLENLVYGVRLLDVAEFGSIWCIEEVNVDAVRVAVSADRCDCFEGIASFFPIAAGHAAGVIDQENGIKLGEKGKRVISVKNAGLGNISLDMACGWCFRRVDGWSI